MEDISKLRQKIINLDKARRAYQQKLIKNRQLISGSLYDMYKKCGNPKCKCNNGKKHGPYLCLSRMKNKKRELIFIREQDSAKIRHINWQYKKFNWTIVKIDKINADIKSLLKKLKEKYEVKYK